MMLVAMQKNILTGQPKPFYLIFFLEIWERFGYYGVQALLVLYMVQKMGFTDTHAYAFFAAFTALAYLLPCVGGYIGDHILGTKRTILLGSVVLAVGYLLLSLPDTPSYFLPLSLSVIAVGVGLFKANPSSLLSKVYEGTHHSRDSGFTLYYMAINIGSFLALNLTPILNKYFGWHVAFSFCFIGLVVAIINYLLMRHVVAEFGSYPDRHPLQKASFVLVILLTFVLIGASFLLLQHYQIVAWLLGIGTVLLLAYFFVLIGQAKPHERRGMILFVILFFQGIVFFVIYFQAPTSLTLFALRNVHHTILSIPVQAAQYQMFGGYHLSSVI